MASLWMLAVIYWKNVKIKCRYIMIWRDFFYCSCRNFQVVLSYPANSCYARLTDLIAKQLINESLALSCTVAYQDSLLSSLHHILNLSLSKISFCFISQKLHLHAWQCLFSSLQINQTIKWLDTSPMIYLQLLSQCHIIRFVSYTPIYSKRTYQSCRS